MGQFEQLKDIENLNSWEIWKDKIEVQKFWNNLNLTNLWIITATLDTALPGKEKIINEKLDKLQQKFA